MGRGHDDSADRAARSVCVAASDCVGGEVQSGAGGKHRRAAIVGAESGAAFERTGQDPEENAATAGRTSASVCCAEKSGGKSERTGASLARVAGARCGGAGAGWHWLWRG